jgi:hypothetical protein
MEADEMEKLARSPSIIQQLRTEDVQKIGKIPQSLRNPVKQL